jgi:hypothetical protein
VRWKGGVGSGRIQQVKIFLAFSNSEKMEFREYELLLL